MPKSDAERQAELKQRREANGQVRRPYWGTPSEHIVIKETLKELRKKD